MTTTVRSVGKLSDRERRIWIAIIVGGFALRALWAALIPIHPISDSSAYDELAWNLASRGVYAWNTGEYTAYWPIGTSFIYQLLFRVFGHSYAPIAAMNALISIPTLIVLMTLTKRWISPAAAVAAGVLFALWPMQIQFTSVMASELIFNLLTLLALWLALEAPFKSTVLRGLVVGLVLAADSYVRVHALLFILLIPIALLWRRRANWPDLLIFIGTVSLTMAVCIAPWTIRNNRVLGEPFIIASNSGAATWVGNNPQSNGEYMPLPDDVAQLSEAERNRVLSERSKDFIRENPDRFVQLSVQRLILTYNRETMGIVWNEDSLSRYVSPDGIMAAKLLSTLYWLGALALAIIGVLLVLIRERWRGLFHPAVMFWAYFAAVHAVTQASDRYHLPSVPYMAILAGLTIAAAWQKWQASRPVRAAEGMAFE
jgi:4-amino-4-deoxy-L-arabinose transferase-like glycosyltransferase